MNWQRAWRTTCLTSSEISWTAGNRWTTCPGTSCGCSQLHAAIKRHGSWLCRGSRCGSKTQRWLVNVNDSCVCAFHFCSMPERENSNSMSITNFLCFSVFSWLDLLKTSSCLCVWTATPTEQMTWRWSPTWSRSDSNPKSCSTTTCCVSGLRCLFLYRYLQLTATYTDWCFAAVSPGSSSMHTETTWAPWWSWWSLMSFPMPGILTTCKSSTLCCSTPQSRPQRWNQRLLGWNNLTVFNQSIVFFVCFWLLSLSLVVSAVPGDGVPGPTNQ